MASASAIAAASAATAAAKADSSGFNTYRRHARAPPTEDRTVALPSPTSVSTGRADEVDQAVEEEGMHFSGTFSMSSRSSSSSSSPSSCSDNDDDNDDDDDSIKLGLGAIVEERGDDDNDDDDDSDEMSAGGSCHGEGVEQKENGGGNGNNPSKLPSELETSSRSSTGDSDEDYDECEDSANNNDKQRLTLDEGLYAEDDEAANAFAAAKFAGVFNENEEAKKGDTNEDDSDDDGSEDFPSQMSSSTLSPSLPARRPRTGGVRRVPEEDQGGARRGLASFSLSPGPRLAKKGRASVMPNVCSKSLSPRPRHSPASRASWSPSRSFTGVQGKMLPSSNLLSPTVGLAPADHGMGTEGNTVVLELGAGKVRAGVVAPAECGRERKGKEEVDGGDGGEGSGGGRKASSYFDGFPCCLARPVREDADFDEMVNGASSLAAPMYSKFRE